MLKGMFAAASAMVFSEHQMSAVSNNIANVNVHGFKKDIAVGKEFPQLLLSRLYDQTHSRLLELPEGLERKAPYVGRLGTGVEYSESYTDFRQGSLEASESPWDLALLSEGFFTIQTEEGLRYTRNGSFTLGKEGFLETHEGFPVLGYEGPLWVGNRTFSVGEQGQVFIQDAQGQVQELDRLQVVRFAGQRFLEKDAFTTFKETTLSGAPQNLEEVRVKQGYLEAANVEIIKEMVQMIQTNRAYEANQKIVQTYDTTSSGFIRSARWA